MHGTMISSPTVFRMLAILLAVLIVCVAEKPRDIGSYEEYHKILRQQAIARNSDGRGGYRWKYKSLKPQQCIDGGSTYYFLDAMPSETRCEKCWCHGDGTKRCKNINACAFDSPVRCVDSVYDERTCCETCPNGANCLVDDRIIPAGETTVIHDEFCHRTCECPPSTAYHKLGRKTQAMCFFSCRDDN